MSEDDDDGPLEWEEEALRHVGALGYVMLKCIQRGEYAVVWDAVAPSGTKVVIKMLELISVVSMSAELAVGLSSSHPNVAPTVAWHWLEMCDGEVEVCIMVMDNAEDYGELSNCIYQHDSDYQARAEWLSGDPRLRRRLCLQLLEGIAYMHGVLGVAHRDIKTANVVVTRDLAKLRIVDNGFCAFLGSGSVPVPEHLRAPPTVKHSLGDSWWKLNPVRVGHPFSRCGTLGYMAPELLHVGAHVDLYKADVYSAGVVIYEMFCGGEPWGEGFFYADLWNDTDKKTLDADYWRNFDAKYRLRRPDGVDPAMWRLIETLMQSDPLKRPTASQALAMFREQLL